VGGAFCSSKLDIIKLSVVALKLNKLFEESLEKYLLKENKKFELK
jgi:hypothetical protein